MRSGLSSSNWRTESPVEMRFIDLFMAAVGSLIFMTMVLVAIVARMPNEAQVSPTPGLVPEKDLRLLTSNLPTAQVGSPYGEALALRGGKPPFTWEIVGSTPRGLVFDTQEGVFQGTPTSPSSASLLVRVHDAAGHATERGYSLTVLQPSTSARSSRWVAYILLAVLALLALLFIGSAWNLQAKITHLEQAGARGEEEVVFSGSLGVEERVTVSEGRSTKIAERRAALFFAGVCLLVGAIVGVYILVTHYRG